MAVRTYEELKVLVVSELDELLRSHQLNAAVAEPVLTLKAEVEESEQPAE
jgi:hypothetical protein